MLKIHLFSTKCTLWIQKICLLKCFYDDRIICYPILDTRLTELSYSMYSPKSQFSLQQHSLYIICILVVFFFFLQLNFPKLYNQDKFDNPKFGGTLQIKLNYFIPSFFAKVIYYSTCLLSSKYLNVVKYMDILVFCSLF